MSGGWRSGVTATSSTMGGPLGLLRRIGSFIATSFTTLPNYQKHELLVGRIGILFFEFICLKDCAGKTDQPFPVGLGNYVDLSFLCDSYTKRILEHLVYLIASIIWLADRSPIINLLSLGTVLTITISYHTVRNGSGTTFHTNQMSNMVLLAQWCVTLYFYLKYQRNSNRSQKEEKKLQDKLIRYHMHVSQQALCAGYLSCAWTKWVGSHGTWVQKAHNFAVTIVSTSERMFYNAGNFPSPFVEMFSKWLIPRPWLARLFFSPGFYFELYFPLCMFNRFTMLLGGIALYMMHHLIYLTMSIKFTAFQYVLLFYFINLQYWLPKIYFTLRAAHNAGTLSSTITSALHPRNLLLQLITPEVKVPPKTAEDLPLSKSHSKSTGVLRIIKKFPFKTAALFLFCMYTVGVKDGFPFTKFAVYTDPKPLACFFYLADKDLKPIWMEDYFMISTAQLKKLFIRFCNGTQVPKSDFINGMDEKTRLQCGNRLLPFIDYRAKKFPRIRKALDELKPFHLQHVQHRLLENGTLARFELTAGRWDGPAPLEPVEPPTQTHSSHQRQPDDAGVEMDEGVEQHQDEGEEDR